MLTLRSLSSNNNLFKVAKIGQDATNTLNTDIRIAETCFIGRNRKELTSIQSTTTSTTTTNNNKEYSSSLSVRDRPGGLYDILDNLRNTLDTTMSSTKLDPNLMELCYVYYPQGGYYRRHCDAVPNSASTLRKYSLLLYLNPPTWDPNTNAGQLRLHFDGGDDVTTNVEPNYIDIDPIGGTLVLFKSELIPHEVLNTYAERYAIVGWYNRHVSITDIGNLGGSGTVSGEGNVVRLAALLVALTLVTYGVVSILL
jgi:Rps23 Pro-64 3,4-dihydroxylase Tpa1-like proline 4-hydroxylase